jgi:apolipoprotein N-acyltransferase
LEVLEKTTLTAAASHPDLILWPEAVTPWAVRGDKDVRGFVESLVARAKAPLVLGSIAVEDAGTPKERWFNGAFAVTPDFGLQTAYYAKRQLVPFGEFVPLRPLLGWLSKFVPIGDDFSRGDDSAPLIVPLHGQSYLFGPLICYEDIYPQLARSSAVAGSEVLVVVTNNGWFGRGGAAYQHAAHAVLRAVETRRPVLRCGNAGWSGWIDEFGGVRPGANLTDEAGSIYFRGTKTVSVSRDVRWIGHDSFYVQYGDWFVLVCAVFAAFGASLLMFNETTKPEPEA